MAEKEVKMSNGWKVFEKRTHNAFMTKYDNQLVVVVGHGKNPYLYFSLSLIDALKKPNHISLHTRGSNVGLMKDEDGSTGYKLQVSNKGHAPYLSVAKFFKEYPLRSGAYFCHMEGQVAVFDSQDTPARIS